MGWLRTRDVGDVQVTAPDSTPTVREHNHPAPRQCAADCPSGHPATWNVEDKHHWPPTVREAGDEGITAVLAAHRVSYHHRNIGGETASTLRYTSCEGCDWQGGHHDESGWEAHLADVLAPLIAERERAAGERALREAEERLADVEEAHGTAILDRADALDRAVAAEARVARVEALADHAERAAEASLSRTFDGGTFGGWVHARDLRAALAPETPEGDA